MKKSSNIQRAIMVVTMLIAAFSGYTQEPLTASYVHSRHNKVAIIPIGYIGDGNDRKMTQMPYHLQSLAHNYLRAEAAELSIQSPMETNAILSRRGISDLNCNNYTPRELASILCVEYVVMGLVNQDYLGSHTNRHSDQSERYRRHNRYEREVRSHSSTRDEHATTIDLWIYNGDGAMIYSKSRRSILSDVDAYKYGLHYLIKRTPLYGR